MSPVSVRSDEDPPVLLFSSFSAVGIYGGGCLIHPNEAAHDLMF